MSEPVLPPWNDENQRSSRSLLVERVANDKLIRLLDKQLDELVVDRGLNVKSRPRRTILAALYLLKMNM